jgi:hypothetical protein
VPGPADHPYIEGDGTGLDITPVMIKVVDAAGGQEPMAARRRSTGWRSTPVRSRPRSMAPMSGSQRKP